MMKKQASGPPVSCGCRLSPQKETELRRGLQSPGTAGVRAHSPYVPIHTWDTRPVPLRWGPAVSVPGAASQMAALQTQSRVGTGGGGHDGGVAPSPGAASGSRDTARWTRSCRSPPGVLRDTLWLTLAPNSCVLVNMRVVG